MITEWVLVLSIYGGGYSSSTVYIPMENKDACLMTLDKQFGRNFAGSSEKTCLNIKTGEVINVKPK